MQGSGKHQPRSATFTPQPKASALAVMVADRLGDEVRLKVCGEIDLTSAGVFEEQVEEHLVPRGRVVLDLSDVPFIDSTGLRSLWMIRQRYAAVGGRLALTSISPNVDRLLQVTKLNKVFEQAN